MATANANVPHKRLYRVYIDESGDHTYRSLGDVAKRYLGLTGCIIEAEYYRTQFRPALENLKQKHFPHDPDEPVILHRRGIVNRKGPFWRLRDADSRQGFDRDILTFFCQQEYLLITVVIDKKSHLARYGEFAFHPYHYCLAALLESYCGFLNFYNAKGDVMAENRQKTEDKKLMIAHQTLYETGTQYRSRDFFRNVLTSHELKLKPKTANIAGLQLADLLAYPSKQEILLSEGKIDTVGAFDQRVGNVIQDKYNRQIYQGKAVGYGKIFLK
jgi:hypothetical protein